LSRSNDPRRNYREVRSKRYQTRTDSDHHPTESPKCLDGFSDREIRKKLGTDKDLANPTQDQHRDNEKGDQLESGRPWDPRHPPGEEFVNSCELSRRPLQLKNEDGSNRDRNRQKTLRESRDEID